MMQMRPTTGPTRKDGVKQKHSVFRNSSQPPKVTHCRIQIEHWLVPPSLKLAIFTKPVKKLVLTSCDCQLCQGMYINHDDLVTLATGPSGQGEAILQGLDRSLLLLPSTWPSPCFLQNQGDSRAQADRAKQQAASLVTPAQGQRPWPGTLQSFTWPRKQNQCKVDKRGAASRSAGLTISLLIYNFCKISNVTGNS